LIEKLIKLSLNIFTNFLARTHKMAIINTHDWAQLRKSFASNPFPSICIDGFLSSDIASAISQSYPKFNHAQDVGLEFKKVNEKKKVQITDPDNFPGPVADLVAALSSKEFITNLEEVSGISGLIWDNNFVGGGMHLTGNAGHLDVHVDFNFEENTKLYRRLNLLIYLNQNWEDSWGGHLELWDEQVKDCFMRAAPVLNRCVIFATSDKSYHGVTAVQCPSDITRNSFAVYYYTKIPPDDWVGDKHSTIFKARPDEKLKKYLLMPAEKLALSKTAQRSKRLLAKLSGRR